MKSLVGSSAFAFALSWGISTGLSGCWFPGHCKCSPPPPHPEQQELPLSGGVDFGEDGNQSIHPIDFAEGTFRIEKGRIVIDYLEGAAAYQVVYRQD